MEEKKICPSCYKRNNAWSFGAICYFCGTSGKPVSLVVGNDWKEKFKAIDCDRRSSRAKPTPIKPEDRIPYSQAELDAVIVYKMPSTPKGGACDWCGKHWKTRKEGPLVCNRCSLNRKQIADEITRITPNIYMNWEERLKLARKAVQKKQNRLPKAIK